MSPPFPGLIYLIGFHLRAGELEWSELNVVDVLPDLLPDLPSAVLRGETYVSIYSPVNADYELESLQPFATLRGEYGGNYGGGLGKQRRLHPPSRQPFRRQSPRAGLDQPALRQRLDASGRNRCPLAMSVTREDAGWSVTIENRTDHSLPQARLVLGQRLYDLGELPPNQSKTFTLTTASGTPLANFVNQHFSSFQNAVNNRRQNFGGNAVAIGNVAEGAMAASFLGKMNMGGQRPGIVSRSFAAWTSAGLPARTTPSCWPGTRPFPGGPPQSFLPPGASIATRSCAGRHCQIMKTNPHAP